MAIFPHNPNERIGDLERDLYSRDAAPITTKKRPELSPHPKTTGTPGTTQGGKLDGKSDDAPVQYGWKEDEAGLNSNVAEAKMAERKSSIATKIFIASVLFFAVAAGIAAYIILGGFNIISSKNVDISVQGLIAVAAGEPLSLDILIKNNNNSALDSGTIYVEYPDGTRKAEDITQELVRDQFEFGAVGAGGLITKTITPVLFGEKDSMKQIKVSIDYKARGSNATFSKEKTFDITIKSSPIIMTVDVPSEVNAGQEIEIKIEVASNSNTLVRDLLVRAEYPFGFSFVSSTPVPTYDKNVWRVGDLNPKDKRTIILKGRMEGQNEEERTFRFSTGAASETDEKQLAVSYLSDQKSLFIKKAFIDLSLQLNGKVGERVVSAGERVQGTLIWSNNLPVAINDAVIQVKLSGKGLDRTQVTPGAGGFFRSVDNTITWDKNSLADLRSIEPGENGSVSFTFSIIPSSQQLQSLGRDINVALAATVSGNRVQSGVPSEVRSGAEALAKLGTNLSVNAKTLYTTGAFTNTGGIPPKAEKETTYTVVMSISNSFNDASNIVLSTQLPPYVRWLNKVSPASDGVAFNESTRTFTWSLPTLASGVGYAAAPKEVSFQIAFLPSLTQVDSVPELTGTIYVSGTDRYTGGQVQSSKPALTTRLLTDPGFENGDDRVVR